MCKSETEKIFGKELCGGERVASYTVRKTLYIENRKKQKKCYLLSSEHTSFNFWFVNLTPNPKFENKSVATGLFFM